MDFFFYCGVVVGAICIALLIHWTSEDFGEDDK